MLTVVDDKDVEELYEHCRDDGVEDAYYAKVDKVMNWLNTLRRPEQAIVSLVEKMLHREPAERPIALDLFHVFSLPSRSKCWQGSALCCDLLLVSCVYARRRRRTKAGTASTNGLFHSDPP